MSGEGMFIPADRLPPGFAERIGNDAAEVALPHPAATTVLLRENDAGPEVLLMRRNRSAGFVPGAYVFPGGRVDPADAAPGLGRHGEPPLASPPTPYWIAALRELFEEAGVLLARSITGEYAMDTRDAAVAALREALLQDRTSMLQVLAELEMRPAFDRMMPCAHWITPVAEPRRFDTQFFLAALPSGRSARADAREMSDALWLTAADALERFREGRLPMVFPTVRTLESIAPYRSVEAALEAFRGRTLTPVLPRLVRAEHGVALVVDEPQEKHDGE
jgi:8-oxo-dGTP pyrophosphatase MutT (NUDIX family)